jgi:CBS domain-containing protein
MQVKDIMTRNPLKIERSCTIKEVSRVLLENGLNSVPVVDRNYRVLGIITRADIFRTILSSYDKLHSKESYWDFEKIEKGARDASQREVEEVMSKPVITLEEDTPVVRAGSIMLVKGIKQLPVVSGEKLTGMVTLTDIIEALIVAAKPSRAMRE